VSEAFSVTVTSPAGPERVFDLLADNAGWSRWAGPVVVRSWLARPGSPEPDGVGAVRGLGTRLVGSREEITEFRRPELIGYRMLSGQPVRNYVAQVRLDPAGEGTRITWSATFDPVLPGSGPLLRRWLGGIVAGFARRLAAAAADRG